MASSLFHRTLQPPTAVRSAQIVPGISQQSNDRLLILCHTHILAFSVNREGLQKEQTWRAPTNVEHLVCLPNRQILLFTQGGQCSLLELSDTADGTPQLIAHSILPTAEECSSNQLQPCSSVISNVMSASMGSGVASLLAVAYQPSMLYVIRTAPADTGSLTLQAKAIPCKQVLLKCNLPDISNSALLAVRVHSQVLSMAWLSDQEQQHDLQGNSLLAVLHEFSPSSQPPLLHVDCLSIDWTQGTASPGPWAIRNVHPSTRLLQPFPGYGVLPAGMMLISSRGVLLCSCVPGQPAAQAGCSSSASASTLTDVAVKKVQLVHWVLQGVPLSCAAVSDHVYIIGDDRAGLYLMHITSSSQVTWQTLQGTSPLPVPHVITYIQTQHSSTAITSSSTTGQDDMQVDPPTSSSSSSTARDHLAGVLFIGSRSSSSQVLGLPASILTAPHHEQQQQQGCVQKCPVLQSSFLPSLAGAQSVVVIKDPTGAVPEAQLLVACGAHPRGKLAVLRSGVGLTPLLVDGPHLPGDAVLFPIEQHTICSHDQEQAQPMSQNTHHQCRQQQQQQQQQQPHPHSLLGFSFPSSGSSHLMSLSGSTFRQVLLPGVQQQQQSLMMAGLPGGWLVQVTPDGVWVIDEQVGNLQHSWQPSGSSGPSTISLAAVLDDMLLVACGATITAINISCCSGQVVECCSCELQQQASAVALMRLADGSCVIAVGLWLDNQLLLLPWPCQQQQQQLVVGCVIDLVSDQARSVAVMTVGDDDVVMVGTNNGAIIMWQLTEAVAGVGQQQQQHLLQSSTAQDASGYRWHVSHCRKVVISSTSVNLQQLWLPASPTSKGSNSSSEPVRCIYAHAGAGAIIAPFTELVNLRQQQQQQSDSSSAADTSPLAATDCLLVSRVCGSEFSLTAAAVHTADMPYSLAWLSGSSRLCFAAVDPCHKLRWRTRRLPGTPLVMTMHKETNTLLLLMQIDDSIDGRQQQQQLVLLEGGSLRVLMTLSLAPGHVYTTLAVLYLPCTTTQQQQQQRACAASAAADDPDEAAAQQLSIMPFIVLGSQVNIDFAGAVGAGRPHAAKQTTAAAAASGGGGGSSHTQVSGDSDSAAVSNSTGTEVGMISVFELRAQVTDHSIADKASAVPSQAAAAPPAATVADSGDVAKLKYDLLLHGLVPLPFSPASLCTAVPEQLTDYHQQQQQQVGQQQAAATAGSGLAAAAAGAGGSSSDGHQVADVQSAAAAAAAAVSGGSAGNLPYLCIGGDAGVVLYEVLVDVAATRSKRRRDNMLIQAAQVTDMNIEGNKGDTLQQQQQEDADSDSRVMMNKVSSCQTLSEGVVVALQNSSSNGSSSCVIASEALGSVTVMKALRSAAGKVQLMCVGADRSGLMVMVPAPMQQTSESTPAAAAAAAGSNQLQAAAPAAAECEGVSSAECSPCAAEHQAILVSTHPQGLMLLQRDLAAEQQHQQLAHEAALQLWEAGGYRPGPLTWQHLQQRGQQLAAALQPWLGAGEAAPWAAAGAPGRPTVNTQRAAGQQPRQAAAALSSAGVGVLDPGADVAPKLLPSAACAPAAGVSIMCAAQLGLHVQKVGQLGSQTDSSSSGGLITPDAPIWCFSPNGAVSVLHLLQGHEAQDLLLLQKQLKSQQPSVGSCDGLLELQPGAGRSCLGLCELHRLGPSSSYSNYQRLRVAADAWNADQADAEDKLPYNCVDGDLLFAVLGGSEHARLHQHQLWQSVL